VVVISVVVVVVVSAASDSMVFESEIVFAAEVSADPISSSFPSAPAYTINE